MTILTLEQGKELHNAVVFTAETLGPQEARDRYNAGMCDYGLWEHRFDAKLCSEPQEFAALIYRQTQHGPS